MRKLLFLLATILCASQAWADGMSTGPLILQDEGTTKGAVTKINCIGTPITCDKVGAVGTVTITGGATFVETEVDFGAVNSSYGSFTVTDAGVSTASKILITQSGNAPTGRSADENDMDRLICNALPAAGSFTMLCKSVDGPVVGKYKVFYVYG